MVGHCAAALMFEIAGVTEGSDCPSSDGKTCYMQRNCYGFSL